MDKNLLEALNSIDEINPYATFLSESTLSRIDGWIDTGSYVLNALISGSLYGGIPKGRVTLLAGESRTGKSLFIQKILANAQKEGLTVVLFDSENALDAEGASRLGLDPSKVKYVPCVTIEQTRNAIYNLFMKVQELGLQGKLIVAIDSLGNLQSELEYTRMGKESTSSDMGSKARAIKSLLQTVTNLGGLTKTTVICSNHLYDNPAEMFPNIEKAMPGGKSTAYLPSVTVQLAKKGFKGDDGKTVDDKLSVAQSKYPGVILRALTVKNRFIKQYLQGEMYLSFSTGLDKYYGLLDLVVGMGVIIQGGSTYTMPDGTKLGFYKNFRKNTDLWQTKLLPALELRLKEEWSYSNNDTQDEIDLVEEQLHNNENEE